MNEWNPLFSMHYVIIYSYKNEDVCRTIKWICIGFYTFIANERKDLSFDVSIGLFFKLLDILSMADGVKRVWTFPTMNNRSNWCADCNMWMKKLIHLISILIEYVYRWSACSWRVNFITVDIFRRFIWIIMAHF